MRAVTVTPEHHLGVSDLPDPDVGPDDVRVSISACGICGSDLHMLEAKLMPVGAVMGHEASGVVESVGANVTKVAVGDHVAIQPFDPCGSCDACRSGAPQRCMSNITTTLGLGFRQGAYADLVVLSERMVVKLPDATPLDVAAISEPLAVALHGYRRSRFEPGMTVGVIGAGPIGLSVVTLAKALGASNVWASDRNAFRLELAERLGADEVDRLPKSADIVFECAGAEGTMDLAMGSARGGGQVVLIAVKLGSDPIAPFLWVAKEIDLVPSLGYTYDEYAECAQMIADGTVDPSPMITKHVAFDDVDGAFAALCGGEPEAKIIVQP